MLNPYTDQFVRIETTCGSLLCELQKFWDEIGEPSPERDKVLLEIEQECLSVYTRKLDDAKASRAQLLRAITLSEAEIVDICSSLGEQPVNCDRTVGGNLKEKFKSITSQLEDARQRKIERKNQFDEVLNQLRKISNEIYTDNTMYNMAEDEKDFSVKRLEELCSQLADLQNDKSNRLRQVMDHLSNLNSLCVVLGVDLEGTISKIHPSLKNPKATKDVTYGTIEKLYTTIESLKEVKIQRMQKLQYLSTCLLELWNLLDTPLEEQCMFQNVTNKIAALEPEFTEPNLLSMNTFKYVEGEVSRLEQLKSNKIKEIVLKKKLELEEMCRKMHMVTEALEEYSIETIESSSVDPKYLLEQIDLQIANLKEEAFSRREILEKVGKWLAAHEEECWLEEYNRDDNRYNAGRGSHLALKRAEKARALVNKIPAMVEALTCKVTSWEKERGTEFLYDGERLLSILDAYSSLKQEKEQERQRQRYQKKLQIQQIPKQEAVYGSKPSPSKSGKKTSAGIAASNRKLSLGGPVLQNLKPEKTTLRVHNKKVDSMYRTNPLNNQRSGSFAPCRRNSEIPERIVTKRSSAKAREVEYPLIRKPLSPISLAISSKANIANFLEDQGRAAVTPSKCISGGNEENKTPKTMPIPELSTPSTVSVSMLMAATPATPFVSLGAKEIEKRVEKDEYSFEEVRYFLS